MRKATFDPAINLDLYFRKGRNGEKEFRFFDSEGVAYPLDDEFEVRSDFEITIAKLDNVLTLAVVGEQVKEVRNSYFYEIVNTTTNRTWFAGKAHFTDTTSAEVADTTDIEINLEGEIIQVTINEAGGESTGDVNGGTP
jgi:hypothetical protein